MKMIVLMKNTKEIEMNYCITMALSFVRLLDRLCNVPPKIYRERF